MTHIVALVLVAVGCAVIVLASVGAVLMPGGTFNRLHFVTPVTSMGAPLVAVGLSVESGKPFTIAEMLFIALLLFVSGPVVESATGRLAGIERGLVQKRPPE